MPFLPPAYCKKHTTHWKLHTLAFYTPYTLWPFIHFIQSGFYTPYKLWPLYTMDFNTQCGFLYTLYTLVFYTLRPSIHFRHFGLKYTLYTLFFVCFLFCFVFTTLTLSLLYSVGFYTFYTQWPFIHSGFLYTFYTMAFYTLHTL